VLSPPKTDAMPSLPVTANPADAPASNVVPGNDAGCREIQVLLPIAGAVKDPTQRQKNGLQTGQQTLIILARERRKEMVLLGRVRRR
jgi:hypothetical protein